MARTLCTNSATTQKLLVYVGAQFFAISVLPHVGLVTQAAGQGRVPKLVVPDIDFSNWAFTCAFSSDMSKVAIGSLRKPLQIRSVYSGKLEYDLRIGFLSASTMEFSPNSRTVAVDGDQNCVELWSTETGRKLQTLRGHRSPVQCIAFSTDGSTIATGSGPPFGSSGELKLWDSLSGKIRRTMGHHRAGVSSVSFFGRKHLLASVSGGLVSVWNTTSGKRLDHFRAGSNHTHTICYSPSGKLLITVDYDKVAFWGERHQRLGAINHGALVKSVAFSKDGKRLAIAGDNGMIRLVDSLTRKHIRKLMSTGSPVMTVAFNHDGSQVGAVTLDSLVRLWDSHSGRLIRSFGGERHASGVIH